MAETPTLFVCHGDDGGPRIHPCRRVQEALRAAGIEYDKVLAAHGSPLPFLRKGSREDLREATGRDEAAGPEAARRHGPHPLARDPLLGRPAEVTAASGLPGELLRQDRRSGGRRRRL